MATTERPDHLERAAALAEALIAWWDAPLSKRKRRHDRIRAALQERAMDAAGTSSMTESQARPYVRQFILEHVARRLVEWMREDRRA